MTGGSPRFPVRLEVPLRVGQRRGGVDEAESRREVSPDPGGVVEPGVAAARADVRCRHGQVLLSLDEIEQAVAEFREAVSINARYADGYAYLGVALRRGGYEDQAMDAFRAALQIDPAHVVAQAEVGRSN